MSFKDRIIAFVAKHGYTYRSYVLSILFLPPAAVYIACKKPGVPLPGRIVLGVMGLVAPPFIGGATMMMIKSLVDLVRRTCWA